MKRLLVVLVSLTGILILTGIFLLFSKSGRGPGGMFRLKEKDIEKISGIVLREDTVSLVLKKGKTGWMVNNRWPVRERAIKVMKRVITHLEVKSPVSGDMIRRALADTAGRNIRVTVYGKLLPLKRYEVVVSDRIPGGNMMRLNRKKEWYIVNLPGEEVNPAAFFITDPYYWRDRTLFDHLPGEVTEVSMEYGDTSLAGFRVGWDTLDNRYYFIPDHSFPAGQSVDTGRIRTYLSWFQHLECDLYDNNLTTAEKDSILQQKPLYILSVRDDHGREFRMRVYPLPDRKGRPGHDPDVARAWVTPLNEMVLIRYYRLDPLLQTAEYFLNPGSINDKFNQADKNNHY